MEGENLSAHVAWKDSEGKGKAWTPCLCTPSSYTTTLVHYLSQEGKGEKNKPFLCIRGNTSRAVSSFHLSLAVFYSMFAAWPLQSCGDSEVVTDLSVGTTWECQHCLQLLSHCLASSEGTAKAGGFCVKSNSETLMQTFIWIQSWMVRESHTRLWKPFEYKDNNSWSAYSGIDP